MPRQSDNAKLLNRPSRKQITAKEEKTLDKEMPALKKRGQQLKANAKLERPYVGKGDGKPTGSQGSRNINKFR